MHLRKSDEALRGGAFGAADQQVNFSAEKPSLTKSSQSSGAADIVDSFDISIDEQELVSVLDTLLASWVLLVQRYQRDAFNCITWGVKDANDQGFQTIFSEELDLEESTAVADFRQKVANTKKSGVSGRVNESSELVFIDGSKDEV